VGSSSWSGILLVPLVGAPTQVLGRIVRFEADAVHLLGLVLADVDHPHLLQGGIEPEPPGVAEAEEHGLPGALGLSTVAVSSGVCRWPTMIASESCLR
jgi:hypothetical protein